MGGTPRLDHPASGGPGMASGGGPGMASGLGHRTARCLDLPVTREQTQASMQPPGWHTQGVLLCLHRHQQEGLRGLWDLRESGTHSPAPQISMGWFSSPVSQCSPEVPPSPCPVPLPVYPPCVYLPWAPGPTSCPCTACPHAPQWKWKCSPQGRIPLSWGHRPGPTINWLAPFTDVVYGIRYQVLKRVPKSPSVRKLTRADSRTLAIGPSRCKAMSSNPTPIGFCYLAYFSDFCFLFIRIVIGLAFWNSIPIRSPHVGLQR
jgi:hypothetical protein